MIEQDKIYDKRLKERYNQDFDSALELISQLYLPFPRISFNSNEINRLKTLGLSFFVEKHAFNSSKFGSFKSKLEELERYNDEYFKQSAETLISDFTMSNLDYIEVKVKQIVQNNNITDEKAEINLKTSVGSIFNIIESIRKICETYKNDYETNESILTNFNILSSEIQNSFSQMSMNAVRSIFFTINNTRDYITSQNEIHQNSLLKLEEINNKFKDIIDILSAKDPKITIEDQDSSIDDLPPQMQKNQARSALEVKNSKLAKEISEEQKEILNIQNSIFNCRQEIENRKNSYQEYAVSHADSEIYSQYCELLNKKKELLNDLNILENQNQELSDKIHNDSLENSDKILYQKQMQIKNQIQFKLFTAYQNYNRKILWDIGNLNTLLKEMTSNSTDAITVVFNNSQLNNEITQARQELKSVYSGMQFIEQKREGSVHIIEELYEDEDVKFATDLLVIENEDAKVLKKEIIDEYEYLKLRLQNENEIIETLESQYDGMQEDEKIYIDTITNLIDKTNQKLIDLQTNKISHLPENIPNNNPIERKLFDENATIYENLLDLRIQYKNLRSGLENSEESEDLLHLGDEIYEKTLKLKKIGVLNIYEDLRRFNMDLVSRKKSWTLHANRGAEKQSELVYAENFADDAELQVILNLLENRKKGNNIEVDHKTIDEMVNRNTQMLTTIATLKSFDDWANQYIHDDMKGSNVIDKIMSLYH